MNPPTLEEHDRAVGIAMDLDELAMKHHLIYIGFNEASTITPEVAKQLLERNFENRKLSNALVDQYAGAMERNEWVYNARTIVLGEDGRLLDGQHVLHAVVQSGATIKALIATGVSDEAQALMDTNRKRTFADMLDMNNEANANNLAAATRMTLAYEKSGGVPMLDKGARFKGILDPTISQLAETLERHPDLRKAVKIAGLKDKRPSFLSQSTVAGMLYLFAMETNWEDAEAFFFHLTMGVGLEADNPIWILRERLLRESITTDTRMMPIVRMAYLVIAYNAWRKGETNTKYNWTPGNVKKGRNPFPLIEVIEADNKEA